MNKLNLLELLRADGIYLPSDCGGKSACGKCRVRIPEDFQSSVSPVTETERAVLSEEELMQGVRLACKTYSDKKIQILLPDSDEHTQILTDTTLLEEISSQKAVNSAAYTETAAERKEAASAGGKRSVQNKGTTAAYGAAYGAAIDIGTTTLAGYLYELNSGKLLATASDLNPQIPYGTDVISRIAYCREDTQSHLAELQHLILTKLNELLKGMTEQAGITCNFIQKLVLVGNTVMEHILLGISPESLGKAPFTPLVKDLLHLSVKELPLQLSHQARILVFPAADGFIGGDHISVLLSTDPKQYSGNTLVVDIGTNTEITLCAGGKLYSTSCATGPALEGACIHHGMRAADGAIDHVIIDPVTLKPDLHVIGTTVPKGICGSGIIDTVAELAACGAIGPEGTFSGRFASDRIITDEKGERCFLLWDGPKGKITITQDDIRAVQLAKAALYGGIRILQKHSGVTSIDRIILAGGFGYYLNRLTALKLGLFPDCDPDIILPVGNAAGAGAVLALLKEDALEKCKHIATEIHFCESANDPDFQKFYGDAMMIPHRTETFTLGKAHEWSCPGVHTGALPDEVFHQDFAVLSDGTKLAGLVKTVKEYRQEAYCTLPLIQNLESCVYGTAMEKKTVQWGQAPSVSPLVSSGTGYWAQGKYPYGSFDELIEKLNGNQSGALTKDLAANIMENTSGNSNRNGIDLLQDDRIQATLEAIKLLHTQDEMVVLEASAPFTILTALLDPRKIYSMMRKDPEKIKEILQKLADAEIQFLEEAFKQGCTVVSLADPLGTVALNGEKKYKELLAPSVIYILKKMRRHTKKGLIHLCGRMATDLIHTGFAVSFPLRVETKETYADMLKSAAAEPKIRMIGPGCIHSTRPAAPILQTFELINGGK